MEATQVIQSEKLLVLPWVFWAFTVVSWIALLTILKTLTHIKILTWCCWKQNKDWVRLTPAECIADFRSVLNCFRVYPLPMLSVTSLARCRAETTETAARRPTPELPAKRRDPPGADRTLSQAAQRSNTSGTRWRSRSRLSRENNTEAASQYSRPFT